MYRFLLVLVCLSLPVHCVVRLSDFYPYGSSTSDKTVSINDDGGSPPVDLSIKFPFFNRLHERLWVNTNGVISFLRQVSQFTPDAFPLSGDRRLIAGYWTDIDTTNGGRVYYRETRDRNLCERATKEIRAVVPSASQFTATWLFIATWNDVAFFGADSIGKRKRNTFQIIMVTNTKNSFVIFNYNKITWTTGAHSSSGGDATTGLGGIPAQVGFNAGDGINFFQVPASRTASIINIPNISNVGILGKWVFRIEKNEIQVGGCQAKGKLQAIPSSGSMLGGESLIVYGPCFKNDSAITATFYGTKTVSCQYVTKFRVKCISPEAFLSGLSGITVTSGTLVSNGTFDYVNLAHITPSVHRRDPTKWTTLRQLGITWDPSLLKTRRVRIDVLGYKEDNLTGKVSWNRLSNIALNAPNTGSYTFTAPSLHHTYDVGVIRISSDAGGFVWNTIALWSDVHDLKWAQGSSNSLDWCQNWLLQENGKSSYGDELPKCPCSLAQAVRDLSRFHADPLCNAASQDNELNCLYSKSAFHCVRSNNPSNKGTGQHCCYDSRGTLLNPQDGMGGAVSSRYHYRGHLPYKQTGKVPFLSYFYGDIIPRLHCCEYSSERCNDFLKKRPYNDCRGYLSPNPAAIYGDPHFITLDDFKYTFNGLGEFTAFQVDGGLLKMQTRFEQSKDSNGTLQRGSVCSAIAIKANGSDIVHIELNEIRLVDTLINKKQITFQNNPWQKYNGLSVLSTKQEEISILFEQYQVAITVQACKNLLTVLVTATNDLKGRTSGLLGTWNDYKFDELTTPNGQRISTSSNTQYIHRNFGFKWVISQRSSLFYYEIGKSYSSYYKPSFVPLFPEDLDLRKIPTKIQTKCAGAMDCLFDYFTKSTTDCLSVEIVNKTKEGKEDYKTKITVCGFFPAVPNGIKDKSGNQIGSVVNISCLPGYELHGNNTRECVNKTGDNATWSGENPICLRPLPPENVNLTTRPNAATLTWVPPSQENNVTHTAYQITVSSLKTGDIVSTVNLSTRTFEVRGLVPGTVYTITVSSVGSGGSESARVGGQFPIPPLPPRNLAVSQVAVTQLLASWRPPSGYYDNFHLRWVPLNNSTHSRIYVRRPYTQHIIQGLSPGTYLVFVSTHSEGMESSTLNGLVTLHPAAPTGETTMFASQTTFSQTTTTGPRTILNPCTEAALRNENNFHKHPYDRTKYIQCGGVGIMHIITCPSGLVWDQVVSACVRPEDVKTIPTCQQSMGESKLPSPDGDPTWYIRCLNGRPTVVKCPANQKWHQAELKCKVGESSTSGFTNPCKVSSTEVQFYPHPGNRKRFIQCDTEGTAYEFECPNNLVWFQPNQTCADENYKGGPSAPYPRPPSISTVQVRNVCTPDGKLYHTHPTDLRRFLQCTAFGKMFVLLCPLGQVFDSEIQVCIRPSIG